MEINWNNIKRLPAMFKRYLEINSEDINLPKSSNLFLSGVTGRVGSSWLTRILEDLLNGDYVIINEIGVFALSQIRNAGLDYFQHHTGRRHFLKYMYNYFINYSYKRSRIYGKGLEGFSRIVPRKAIKLAFSILENEIQKHDNSKDINKCFGTFYSNVLNYHALLKYGTTKWIHKELSYGRYIRQLYQMIPDCKVVILVRDGRDTALSMAKLGWYDGDILQCMNVWQIFAEMTLQGIRGVPEENYLIVKYEDMTREICRELLRIFDFFELYDLQKKINRIDFKQYHLAPKHNNINKWETELNAKEIKYFNDQAFHIMEKFGY